IRRLKLEVEATEKLIRSKRKSLRPIAIRQLQDRTKTEHVVRGNEDQQELAMLDDLERLLIAEVKSISDTNKDETKTTLDLQQKQDDIAQSQTLVAKISDQLEALNVELSAPPRITSIEDAVAPTSRDNTRRFATIALVIFGGFFGGLFGVAFLELQT